MVCPSGESEAESFREEFILDANKSLIL